MHSQSFNSQFELLISLEINAPESGRYRRPYIAIWVEDKEGYPVRSIALWLMSRQPGPRWIPDLRRWYRSDRMRQYTDKTDLIATTSSPTRQPGKYSVVWDGTGDDKKPVKQGEYMLYIEAVREHGTYQLIKKVITVAEKPFQADLGGNIEIKSATLEYRKRR